MLGEVPECGVRSTGVPKRRRSAAKAGRRDGRGGAEGGQGDAEGRRVRCADGGLLVEPREALGEKTQATAHAMANKKRDDTDRLVFNGASALFTNDGGA
jgi:hypothetical protein